MEYLANRRGLRLTHPVINDAPRKKKVVQAGRCHCTLPNIAANNIAISLNGNFTTVDVATNILRTLPTMRSPSVPSFFYGLVSWRSRYLHNFFARLTLPSAT